MAADLRRRATADASAEELTETKEEALAAAHRILCLHLGTPPTSFTWQWCDSEKGFHRDGELTPRHFVERYVTLPIDDYVCLVHDPRPSSPFGRTFTVEHLGNVVGAPRVVYLNVEIEVMKELAASALVGSAGRPAEPVWFGCDVAQMLDGELGLWHASLYDYDELYGTQDTTRGRVENSWGTEKADKGRRSEGRSARRSAWLPRSGPDRAAGLGPDGRPRHALTAEVGVLRGPGVSSPPPKWEFSRSRTG